VRWLVLTGLVAGCTSSADNGGAALGEPCSQTQPCNSDGVCDYQAIYEAVGSAGVVCIDKDADPDNDGIPNSMDHCPDSPGGLYDEDNDGIGDECDKCPIAPPPATPDLDNDDVDRPCDPDPDTPGDKILFFDGFEGSALGSAWIASGPEAWTPIGGELQVVADQPDEEYLQLVVEPVPSFAIETAYRIDALDASAATHKVIVRGYDSSPAGMANFECGVTTSDLDATMPVVAVETNLDTASTPALGSAFSTNSFYESAAYETAANVQCAVVGDNQALGAAQDQITPASLGTAAIGVRATDTRFEWVLVVGRPNSTGSGTPQ
jgi:hypothetical protein